MNREGKKKGIENRNENVKQETKEKNKKKQKLVIFNPLVCEGEMKEKVE